jgi:hypothetical protein
MRITHDPGSDFRVALLSALPHYIHIYCLAELCEPHSFTTDEWLFGQADSCAFPSDLGLHSLLNSPTELP